MRSSVNLRRVGIPPGIGGGSSSARSGCCLARRRNRNSANPGLTASSTVCTSLTMSGCSSRYCSITSRSGIRALRINQAIGRSAESAVLITGSSASSGYSGTCWRRLLTFSNAFSMFVPTLNSSVICPLESMHSEIILVTPSTLCSCSSCSWMISLSISLGLAPGHRV